ncbi:MAG: Asp-tRNA(Asn)/Glu-tRNA(Gln) amidotransferase subunit GatC [Deltaproteobacteria bacterium]|nr:Asp-tRNA(Asn)/Glu-tRNA(Gln) amidotransferase subunit GatC [Deltaproteobacteria bacterium]
MPITTKDVMRVADLARLDVNEADAVLYASQLQKILGHVEKLSEVDTLGADDKTAKTAGTRPLREDKAVKGLSQDDALKNAPERSDGCIKVPQIIE